MILFDTTTRSLEFKLSGIITTNQLPFVASYVDVSQSTFGVSGIPTNTGASNNTTAVTLVAVPAATTSRQLKFLSIKNSDTVAATVIVQYNDNATLREIGRWTLAVNDTLQFIDGIGFNVIDSSGAIKSSGGGGGNALTSNPLSQFASTTSAQLAGVISDETGSGALVFANSPALTTPNIGTATGSISGNSATVTNGVYTGDAGTVFLAPNGSAANLTSFPTLNQNTTGTAAKADALNSATTVVNVAAATAPTTGQVLTATSGTAATWQTPSGGSALTVKDEGTNLSTAVTSIDFVGAGVIASNIANAITVTIPGGGGGGGNEGYAFFMGG